MTRHIPAMVLAFLLGMAGAGMIGAWLEKVNEATRFNPQADCKSGAGCCRPRLQADSSWEIECTDEEWK